MCLVLHHYLLNNKCERRSRDEDVHPHGGRRKGEAAYISVHKARLHPMRAGAAAPEDGQECPPRPHVCAIQEEDNLGHENVVWSARSCFGFCIKTVILLNSFPSYYLSMIIMYCFLIRKKTFIKKCSSKSKGLHETLASV